MKKISCLILLLVAASSLLSCVRRQPQPDAGSGKIRIFVSILPEAYFVERIGGPYVQVNVLVGPGQSPHVYSPTPRQMAGLAQAQVFFRIGVEMEDQLMKKIPSVSRNIRIVDLRQGVKLRAMEGEPPGAHHEEGGEEHEHHHDAGAPDPHIWLSPVIDKTIARTIAAALSELDPAHTPDFEKNLDALVADLDALDKKIADVLAPFKGGEIMVFHPAFGYFADQYGLKQFAVEVGGKEPSARQLADLIAHANERNIKLILVQKQFSMQKAQAVADAIGGAVVAVDPLAKDFIANLEQIAEAVARAAKPAQ